MKKLNWHLYMILLVGVMMWAAVPVTAAAADASPHSESSPSAFFGFSSENCKSLGKKKSVSCQFQGGLALSSG